MSLFDSFYCSAIFSDISKPNKTHFEPTSGRPASTTELSLLRGGSTICSCCGSQTVTELALDAKNQGITLSVTKEKDELESSGNFVVDNVKVGNIWFNFKLRVSE